MLGRFLVVALAYPLVVVAAVAAAILAAPTASVTATSGVQHAVLTGGAGAITPTAGACPYLARSSGERCPYLAGLPAAAGCPGLVGGAPVCPRADRPAEVAPSPDRGVLVAALDREPEGSPS
jgi:hypothetical protein